MLDGKVGDKVVWAEIEFSPHQSSSGRFTIIESNLSSGKSRP